MKAMLELKDVSKVFNRGTINERVARSGVGQQAIDAKVPEALDEEAHQAQKAACEERAVAHVGRRGEHRVKGAVEDVCRGGVAQKKVARPG